MTYIKQTTLKIGLLLAIVFSASALNAANPAAGPISTFPNGNTEFPVNVAGTSQVKTGGIAIGATTGKFIAYQNAAFDLQSFVEGILIGNPINPEDSTLSIGDSTTLVDLTVQGSAYVTDGGYYSEEIVAAGGEHEALCADNNGNIIFCPTPPPEPPVPPENRLSAHLAYQCLNTYTGGNDLQQGEGQMTIYLHRQLTEPVTVQMAACQDSPHAITYDICEGSNIMPSIPSGFIAGTSVYANPYQFTIPAGVSQYNVPFPLTYAHLGQPNNVWTCGEDGKERIFGVKRGPVTRIKYLYFKVTSGTPITLSMTGHSYQRNYTSPNQIVITQLP